MPEATVASVWPGETVVCIASGPSLTLDDVEYCRGRARVVVVNDGYKLAPWAECLYACDEQWWEAHEGVPGFQGMKYSLATGRSEAPPAWGVTRLRNVGVHGLSLDPSGLKTGRNSGYQAINLAVHFGAARIILLGYDMQRTGGKGHWFGEHPHALHRQSPYEAFVQSFETIVEPLRRAGVAVVNCSRDTALTMFPRMSLTEALA